MSRRGENIYKRKDGRWEGRFIKGRSINNRAQYGYLYGKSYSEVKNKLKNAEIKNETVNTVESIYFKEVIEEWLEFKKLNVKLSTMSRYKSIVYNHIIPWFGNYEINLISTEIIQQFLNKLLFDGLSNKTVNDILTVIKNIFRYAELRGIKFKVVLNAISVKSQKNNIETLTVPEEKRLCNYLLDNMNNKNLGILLCLYTGIRIGELCALKWSDIDLREKTVSINKTMIRIQKYSLDKSNKTEVLVTSPKSDDSTRVIPLSECLISVIKDFIRNRNAYFLTGLIDKYVEPRNMQYYFKSVLKKCGIKDYKFHILRHTFATRCVENGFEIKSLSEILGHSSIKITLDRYVHSSIDIKRKEMQKINFLSA